MIPYRKTWLVNDRILDFSRPRIMGILNVTDDSFYDGGLYKSEKACKERVVQMVEEGADIIDIGAMSSRPGAVELPEEHERSRIRNALEWIAELGITSWLSIDTYRGSVMQAGLDHGAHICNDISGGALDAGLWPVVAKARIPYILMHMPGNPRNMQQLANYEDVVKEILHFFINKIRLLNGLGIYDVMVDPGFGFGKTLEHNYTLLHDLNAFHVTNKPILAGLSRKGMVYRTVDRTPDEVLPATSALHLAALERGANVIRVHDVEAARQVIAVFEQLNSGEPRF
ncbi:MAG: dihydropteroate synthase [Saprospiraceae bacterium]